MARREFELEFEGGAAGVWAALADTARFNEASGVPAHRIEAIASAENDIAYVAHARLGPFEMVWDDLPPNWVRNRWLEHRRRFRKGPLRRLDASFTLEPHGAGCRCAYALVAEPHGLAGRLVLAGGFFERFERTLRRLARQADAFALGEREIPFDAGPPSLPQGAAARLRRIGERLAASPYGHGLGGRLVELVRDAPELEVRRIRPLSLARRWRVPQREAIEACLLATREGLLGLRWDLLCPRCRGGQTTTGSLDALPRGAHCDSCNIDYGRDFSANVELSFRPAEAVRPVGTAEFCLMGPMSTPHVWAHVTLAPGGTRELGLLPPPRPYRLRTLEAGGSVDVDWHEGGFPELVVLDAGEVAAGEPAPTGRVRLSNRSRRERTLVIEERGWVADALTADRVTALQAFRDLFSDQVLRPGDEVAIDTVALLFSDLEGSTSLYASIGDAGAYRVVREHFAWLAGIVREHEGAVVKTIGDAVMAAFKDPALALAAALAMQRDVARFNREHDAALVLKLGLHEGPCIAVTLNDRLDYFGGTVNLAARLQQQSRGGDIVLSTAMAADPEIARQLGRIGAERERASLKGFADPVPFLRLDAAQAG